MKKYRVRVLMLVMVMVLSSILAGCGRNESAGKASEKSHDVTTAGSGEADTKDTEAAETAGIDLSEEVEIIMYLIGNRTSGFDDVLAEINKKAKEDLNCTLTVNYLTWGEYKTKYPLLLSSGEPVDLIYVATWLNFYDHAAKGAFKALDELLPAYCKETYPTITETALKQATVDDKLYAIPGSKEGYNAYGAVVRRDLMEKYGFESLADIDEWGEFLKAVAKNEKGMVPTFFSSTGSEIDATYMAEKGLYPLTGNYDSIYWIDPSQESPKVISVAEWEETPVFLAKMKEWNEAGCWSKSALSDKDTNKMENGTGASRLKNLDTWIDLNVNTEWDWDFYDFVSQTEILSSMQDSMAVPVSSKNTERALMLLDKFKTDKTYYDLLNYGIEGKTYNLHENNSAEIIDPDYFTFSNGTWGMENREYIKNLIGSPENLDEIKEDYHNKAVDNKYRAFVMNTDAVKNEFAAVKNVMEQYWNPLELGFVDDVTGFEEFRKQMKAAGNDKVIAALQAQVDEFTAANK